MKDILCFGDSNTWGCDPEALSRDVLRRFDRDTRWPGVLARELGPDYHIVEEGQNGRTTVWEDPVEGHMSGLKYLTPCLESHAPLDWVILMLGTNDLKQRYAVSPTDIAWSAARLVELIQKSNAGPDQAAPRVLLVAPAPLATLSGLAGLFDDGVEKSRHLAELYRKQAELTGCDFFDAGTVVRTSDLDGVHWEADYHAAFGKAVAQIIKQATRV